MLPIAVWLWDTPALVYQLLLLVVMSPRCIIRGGRGTSYDDKQRRWSCDGRPKKDTIVLIVPGGGWQSKNDDRHYDLLAEGLARMGWTTAVATYPREQTRLATRCLLWFVAPLPVVLLGVALFSVALSYWLLYADQTAVAVCSVVCAAVSVAWLWVATLLGRMLTSDASASPDTTLDTQVAAVRRAADALHRDFPDSRLVVVAHECGALLARRALTGDYPFELVALSGVFDLAVADSLCDLWRAPASVRRARTGVYDKHLPPACKRAWLATGYMCMASRQMQSEAFLSVCTDAKVPVERVINCGAGSGIHSAVHPYVLTFLVSVLGRENQQ